MAEVKSNNSLPEMTILRVEDIIETDPDFPIPPPPFYHPGNDFEIWRYRIESYFSIIPEEYQNMFIMGYLDSSALETFINSGTSSLEPTSCIWSTLTQLFGNKKDVIDNDPARSVTPAVPTHVNTQPSVTISSSSSDTATTNSTDTGTESNVTAILSETTSLNVTEPGNSESQLVVTPVITSTPCVAIASSPALISCPSRNYLTPPEPAPICTPLTADIPSGQVTRTHPPACTNPQPHHKIRLSKAMPITNSFIENTKRTTAKSSRPLYYKRSTTTDREIRTVVHLSQPGESTKRAVYEGAKAAQFPSSHVPTVCTPFSDCVKDAYDPEEFRPGLLHPSKGPTPLTYWSKKTTSSKSHQSESRKSRVLLALGTVLTVEGGWCNGTETTVVTFTVLTLRA